MDIFVGSLSFKLKESELREAFEKYGKVSSAKIIIDKITRQSKGFGFIEMPDEVEARAAINALNGADMYGRPLVVNESQKREPRGDSGAPRPDTRSREGFNRPRPAGNDAPGSSRTPYSSDRSIGRDSARPLSLDDDDQDDDDAPSTPTRPAERSFGDRSFSSGAGPNFRQPDKPRDKGHHDRGHDHNRHQGGGRPKTEDRYSTKKGGGGSKDYGRRFGSSDDDWD
ncbi:RNA-binding protein [Dyadobacter endophyticus]|uniref:RNA recognition motif domain-containing protein n=1 Tax=Dyadobacter endophyticus TaxID=1749036 RepID=UPI003CEE389C